VAIPSGVTVSCQEGSVSVKGPKGTLAQAVPAGIQVEVAEGQVRFTRPDDGTKTRACGRPRGGGEHDLGVTSYLRSPRSRAGYRAEVKGRSW
jgi:large subunit ribosomal protein L6